MNFKKIILYLSAVTLLSLFIVGCSSNNNEDSINVGWTQDTENAILGNMVKLLLENQLDVSVEKSADLGGTGLAHDAIIADEIDIYVDYTGDALANVLKQDPIMDSDEAFEAVKEGFLEEHDITWLEPSPFNNTYSLALRSNIADELNINTISDLEEHASEWELGSSIEFANRELDGYSGMTEHYGFEFKKNKPMDTGLMYVGANKQDIDVIVAFATDARIGKFDLKVIEDDKDFFPAYNAAPTVRNEILDDFPEISDVLNDVITEIDTDTMIELNGKVDMEDANPSDVAEEYLTDNNYID